MANQSEKSPFGPGRDGRPKGVPNTPGQHGPARGADAFQGHHVPGNIARDGAPKNHHDVPVHGGMVTRSRQGTVHQGGDDLSRFTADPANPLGGAPRGKVLTPVQPVSGQRSRENDPLHGGEPGEAHAKGKPDVAAMRDLGRAILAEAFAASGSDDRMAHGYGIGSLPDSTSEQS